MGPSARNYNGVSKMKTESEFAVNGVAYVAHVNDGQGCLGCEFHHNGCVAAKHPCLDKFRPDNQSIIWKRKLDNHGE